MTNAGGDASLGEEHPLKVRLFRQLGEHRLQRDDLRKAMCAVVSRCPHRGHSSAPHATKQFVAPQIVTRADTLLHFHVCSRPKVSPILSPSKGTPVPLPESRRALP